MSDPEIIDRFLKGDASAFNLLVWQWEKRIYNFILRYVGDREQAQDLSQKTFIRVYQNLHRLRDPRRFSTWIHQIAVNLCRDELKSRRRRRWFSLEALREKRDGHPEAGNLTPPHDAAGEAAAHQNDLRDILNRALQSIPEEQRVVVIMKIYQDLKFTEIAEALDTSVNTVKSRLYYGLRALKKVFDGWNIDKEMLTNEM